jgi:hypothetical protein
MYIYLSVKCVRTVNFIIFRRRDEFISHKQFTSIRANEKEVYHVLFMLTNSIVVLQQWFCMY